MWKTQRKKNQQSKEENQREVLILEKQTLELQQKDPQTLTRFSHFPISKNTLRALKVCKYYAPTLVQQITLPHALQGQDVVADAKTGSGKTLAFVIPVVEALYRACWCRNWGLAAIIVAPTRELAYQVHEVVKRVIQFHKFTSALIIGGKDLLAEYEQIGNFNILVCTPGRLHQHVQQSPNFNTDTLKMFVIDEADLCLSMGFADMMNRILGVLPEKRQTMLFSATQTRDIRTLIKSGCTKPVFCSTHEHTKLATPAKLKQSYSVCEAHDKLNFVYSFLNYYKKKKVLVFLSTCKQVKLFSSVLSNLKLRRRVVDMHGCMKQHMRLNMYNLFQSDKTAVMIATDIASRGLDFSGVEWVVQLDCPENVTTYVHRVGRTARYFCEGEALLLLTRRECQPMLDKLQQHRIQLDNLAVESGMLKPLDSRVEDVLLKNPEVLAMAQRAFKAYLKNIQYMSDKSVFDVTSVDRDRLARSFGLVTTPQLKFTERSLDTCAESRQVYSMYGGPAENRLTATTDSGDENINNGNINDNTQERNKESDGCGDDTYNNSDDESENDNIDNIYSDSVNTDKRTIRKNKNSNSVNDTDDSNVAVDSNESYSTNEDQDNNNDETQKISSQARALYTNESVKKVAIVAEDCPFIERFEDLFSTVSELSGPLAEPPQDYSKYLYKSKSKPQQDLTDVPAMECGSCLTLSSIMTTVQRNRKENKIVHKQKLKERRRDVERKRQAKKHDKTAGGEKGWSDSDDEELDPSTQQIIDELPDPDEIRRREKQRNGGDDQDEEGDDDGEEFSKRSSVVSEQQDNTRLRDKRLTDKRKRDSQYAEDKAREDESRYCKRFRLDDSESEDEPGSTSLRGLSLQQQEHLALQLLMGNS